MEPLKTIAYKGYSIEVYPDNDPIDPREDVESCFGRMVCFHRRYTIGDKHNFTVDQAKALANSKDVAVCLDLYLFDHLVQTIRASGHGAGNPFGPESDPYVHFDSGQIGFIYITKAMLRREYKVKHVTKRLLKKAEKMLYAEVSLYNDYILGNYYGYKITDPDGEEIDSRWGFGGDDAYKEEGYMVTECKAIIDGINVPCKLCEDYTCPE